MNLYPRDLLYPQIYLVGPIKLLGRVDFRQAILIGPNFQQSTHYLVIPSSPIQKCDLTVNYFTFLD